MTLALNDIEVSLAGQPILRGIDLEVHSGEVVGLLGGNGAGKTTLVRVASGVLNPDAGSIKLAGRALDSYSRRELAQQIAVVPQDLHVPFPFRAGEIVLMGRAPYQSWYGFESREDVECAREAMAILGIEHLINRSILDLSGGERQLVLVARALAQESPWLLLDEPTAFLDLRHRVTALRVIRERAARGHGALVVSHDLSLASRVCDRLVLLCDGEIVAQGAPEEVLTPARVLEVFGIEVQVIASPEGAPIVIPEISMPTRRE